MRIEGLIFFHRNNEGSGLLCSKGGQLNLEWKFLDSNLRANPVDTLLKCRFLFCRRREGPRLDSAFLTSSPVVLRLPVSGHAHRS